VTTPASAGHTSVVELPELKVSERGTVGERIVGKSGWIGLPRVL
jgi:hypothetical protein